jgi:hypothetical protein
MKNSLKVATCRFRGYGQRKYKASLIESYRYIAAFYVKPANKDYNKALEYLEKILMLDPDDKNAREGIDAIKYELKNKKSK